MRLAAKVPLKEKTVVATARQTRDFEINYSKKRLVVKLIYNEKIKYIQAFARRKDQYFEKKKKTRNRPLKKKKLFI